MDVKMHAAFITTLFFGVTYSNPPFYGNIERPCGSPEEGITKVPVGFGNHKENIVRGIQGFEAGLSGDSNTALGFGRGSVAGCRGSKGRAVGIGSTVGHGSGEFEGESVDSVGDESVEAFGIGLGTEFTSGKLHAIDKAIESGEAEELRDAVKIGGGNKFLIEERDSSGTDFPTVISGGTKDAELLSESELENIREVFGGGPNIGIGREGGDHEVGYGAAGKFKDRQGLGLAINKGVSVGFGGGQMGGFGGEQYTGFGVGRGHDIKKGFGEQSTWFRGGQSYGFGGGYGDTERYRNKYVGPIGLGRQEGIGFQGGCTEDEETGLGKGVYAGAQFVGGQTIVFRDEYDKGFGPGQKFRFGESAYEDDEYVSFQGGYKGKKFGTEEGVGPLGGKHEGGFGTVRGQGSGTGSGSFVGSGSRRFTDIFAERERGQATAFGRYQGGGFGQGWRRGFGVTQGQGFEADGYFGERPEFYK